MLTPLLVVLPLIAPAVAPAVHDDVFPERTFHISGDGVRRADFDGDGHQDLVVVGGDGVLRFLFGDGHGAFAKGAEVSIGSQVSEFVCGDYNRDGAEDLAAATNNGDVVIVLGDGAGGFAVHATLPVASAA